MTSLALLVVRSHLRRHWRSLVLLGVATGLLGGAAIAAFAGARRTDTAYDRLIESTDFPDGIVQLARSDAGDVDVVANSEGVERVRVSSFTVGIVGGANSLTLIPVQASPGSETFHQVVEGRETDPSAPDEITISERMSEELDLAVGDVFEHVALTDREWGALLEDEWDGAATGLALDLRVVGITRTPLDAITDGFPTIFGTPSYHALLDPGPESPASLWVDVASGTDIEGAVSAGVAEAGALTVLDFRQSRRAADEAISLLTTGLLVLGAVGGAAALAGAAQLGARHADRLTPHVRVLAGLGLTRRELRVLTAVTVLPAATLAMVTATVFANAASQFTPVGAARGLEPNPGTAIHLGIAAIGAIAVGLLGLTFSLVAIRPTLRERPEAARARRPLRLPGALVGGPVGTVTRTLTDDAGRGASSRRLAAIGVGAGATGLIGLVVFSATLHGFVTEPSGWGEIADHEVNLPAPVRDETLATLLDAEEVAAYAEVVGGEVEVAGVRMPGFWFEARRGSISPTVVDGRVPASQAEIALGPAALDRLDLALGDPVEVDGSVRTIVGSVLGFAADGGGFADSAILGGDPSIPSNERYTQALVRFRSGVDPAKAGAVLYGDLEYGTFVRPVSVTNLAELAPMLPLLFVVVAVVGLASLVHLAVAIGTRARGDLAVLRAMGMRRFELTGAVVAATVLLAVAGGLLALPFVVLLVRATWWAALEATDVTVGLSVPASSLVIMAAVVALVTAAGSVAGRHAMRTSAASVLRSE